MRVNYLRSERCTRIPLEKAKVGDVVSIAEVLDSELIIYGLDCDNKHKTLELQK